MYVAVKGGEAAILNSYQRLAEQRRGDPAVPETQRGPNRTAAQTGR